jgi:formate dehydrogenase subunit gamma
MDPAVVIGRQKEDVLVGDEIIRHKLSSRVVHWAVAVTFFLSLFTGMPIWTPVFGWMAHLFGGLSVCRVLHPWAGLAFSLASVVRFSGLVIWFPRSFPQLLREFSYLIHDVTFILFVVAIVFHIYLGTSAEPGTFRSMTRGTVTRKWARLHHPRWYREVTGEDARRP